MRLHNWRLRMLELPSGLSFIESSLQKAFALNEGDRGFELAHDLPLL